MDEYRYNSFDVNRKKYIEVIGYMVLCLCAIFTSIFNTNDYIYKIRAEAYMDKPDDKSLCPIYQFNAKNLKKIKKQFCHKMS